jgi:hypothetical protein
MKSIVKRMFCALALVSMLCAPLAAVQCLKTGDNKYTQEDNGKLFKDSETGNMYVFYWNAGMGYIVRACEVKEQKQTQGSKVAKVAFGACVLAYAAFLTYSYDQVFSDGKWTDAAFSKVGSWVNGIGDSAWGKKVVSYLQDQGLVSKAQPELTGTTNTGLPKTDGLVKVELTKVEQPKVELTKVDVKLEQPVVNQPIVELPKVEVKSEQPMVELTKVETKVEQSILAQLPVVKNELAKVELTNVEQPKVELPKVELTKVELTKVDLPKVEIESEQPVNKTV